MWADELHAPSLLHRRRPHRVAHLVAVGTLQGGREMMWIIILAAIAAAVYLYRKK
jgi:hypothetical protein